MRPRSHSKRRSTSALKATPTVPTARRRKNYGILWRTFSPTIFACVADAPSTRLRAISESERQNVYADSDGNLTDLVGRQAVYEAVVVEGRRALP
jgi:hypothetical protein